MRGSSSRLISSPATPIHPPVFDDPVIRRSTPLLHDSKLGNLMLRDRFGGQCDVRAEFNVLMQQRRKSIR